jgi:tRNA(fMet)-specific endonuclease VapC
MNILFDTNILLHYLRSSAIIQQLEEKYKPFDSSNTAFLSVVSVGEIYSLAKQNQWGEKKIILLEDFLTQFVITDIHSEDVIAKYAEIDAYSQGKLLTNPLQTSARNMGKNDIWIAATAAVLVMPLLTTDSDFAHLQSIYLDILPID